MHSGAVCAGSNPAGGTHNAGTGPVTMTGFVLTGAVIGRRQHAVGARICVHVQLARVGQPPLQPFRYPGAEVHGGRCRGLVDGQGVGAFTARTARPRGRVGWAGIESEC
jgi:hypothetical protein